jgi:hypothetical protein
MTRLLPLPVLYFVASVFDAASRGCLIRVFKQSLTLSVL